MEGRSQLYFQPGELGRENQLKELVQRFRNNCEVLVYVDLAKVMESGIRFYRSSNNVVMTTGDMYGRIPSRFFLKAVHISPTTGDQIWIETLGNDDCINDSQIISGLEHRAEADSKTVKIPIPKGPNPFPIRSRNTSAVYSEYRSRGSMSESKSTRSRHGSENSVRKPGAGDAYKDRKKVGGRERYSSENQKGSENVLLGVQ